MAGNMENKYLFNAEDGGFYPFLLKEDYETAGTWPLKGKEITSEVYFAFAPENAPKGKMRGSDKKGNPCWVEIPPLSHDEAVAAAEAKKAHLLSEAAEVIAPLQDAVDLDMATPEEKALLTEWKKYRVLINRIDTSAAPDIIWPEKPE
nr:tail fiber assembly protein [Morganella morganii]